MLACLQCTLFLILLFYPFFVKPATSNYIVKDNGNCSPRYMRCTINQVRYSNLSIFLAFVYISYYYFYFIINLFMTSFSWDMLHKVVLEITPDTLFGLLDSMYCRSFGDICNAVGFVDPTFSSSASI